MGAYVASEMYTNTTLPHVAPASASLLPMDLLPLYFQTEGVSSSPPSTSPSVLLSSLATSGDKCLDNDTEALNVSSSLPAVAPPPLQPLVSPLVAAYLIFVVVVSVVANALVVVVRACGRRRRLRSSHVCTLSLAVSDVAFSLLVHTLMILAALGVDPMLLFNEPGCNYYGFCAMFFGTFSMCIHASVSIIRYVNICHPERVEWLKVKYVYSLISFSAVYSAIWALGPLLQWGRYETFEFGCTLAFSDPTQSSQSFVTCAFIFVLLLPLAIVIVCYSLIVLQAHKFKREMNRIKCTGKVLASIPAAGERKESAVDSLRKTQRSFRLHNRLVRISMVVAAGYVFGWLPYALVCMWAAYGDYNSIPVEIRVGASLICKSTTAYNPFIYYFMSEGFRADLRYLGRRTGFTSRAPSINTGQASYLSSTRSSLRKWRDRPRENSCLLASRRENTSCTLETVAAPASILPSPDTTDEPLVDHASIITRRTSSCLPLSTSSLQQQYASVEKRLRMPLSSSVFLSDHELMNNGFGRALRYGAKFPCRRSVSFSAATTVTEESSSVDDSMSGAVLNDRSRGVRAFRSVSFYGFRDQRKLTATQLDKLSKRCLYMNTRV